MDRRDLLKLALATGFSAFLPRNAQAAPRVIGRNRFGWNEKASRDTIQDFIETHEYPFFSQQSKDIKGTGEGKIVLLHKCLEKASGTQYNPADQAIGDCVGQGFALTVDALTATQIEIAGQPEQWVAPASSEVIYAGSRVEVAKQRDWQDGSTGHWAAEFIMRWGILLRQPYPGGSDFTKYSGKTARDLGYYGVPDELEPLCKLHPVKTAALVKTYEECRDAIVNGYPVAVCSNVGFGTSSNQWVRDSQGFLRRKREPWYHCMAILGVDDTPGRPGCLVFNSWGPKWCTGPVRLDQPFSTFWVDAETIDAMMRQGDSFALSSYVGYPGLSVPSYVIWSPMP